MSNLWIFSSSLSLNLCACVHLCTIIFFCCIFLLWLRMHSSIPSHFAKFNHFNTTGRVDKLDTSFSRSRSSSMSSLENISTESVTCLAFTDSYTKKSGKFEKQKCRSINFNELILFVHLPFAFICRSIQIIANIMGWYKPWVCSNHIDNVTWCRSAQNTASDSNDYG